MFYVYIVKSDCNKLYKDFTENPLLRLQFHNEGKSPYTSKFKNWQLIALFEFEIKKEALEKEKKLKKYPTKSLIALINSNNNFLQKYLNSLENY